MNKPNYNQMVAMLVKMFGQREARRLLAEVGIPRGTVDKIAHPEYPYSIGVPVGRMIEQVLNERRDHLRTLLQTTTAAE